MAAAGELSGIFEVFYGLFETASAVFVGCEQVEAGAAWREQHGVAGCGEAAAGIDGCLERRCGFDADVGREEVGYFFVVQAHGHYGFHFFAHERQDFVVVVAFVLSAENEHGGGVHGSEGVEA